MATLARALRIFRVTPRRISPSSIIYRRFATSSPPPPPSKPGVKVLSAGAADFVDEDDLHDDHSRLLPPPPASCRHSSSHVSSYTTASVTSATVVLPSSHIEQWVKWVIKADKDRKIKFCCLQSKAAEPYMRLCDVDRDDVLRRFLFIEGPGLYHQGSTAALKVLSYLPLPYSALSSLLIVPTPLREAVYDYVANNRYNWFGKDNDCLVLKEKELLHRFIDREELMDRDSSDL